MTKQDWLLACLVALCVAGLIVWGDRPGDCRADESAPAVAIPALPAAELALDSIQAKVSASAVASPGQPVKVHLTLTAPADKVGTIVPVSVLVSQTVSNPMARTNPLPTLLAQVETSMTIGADGAGQADVELPLVWAQPAPTAEAPATQPDDATRAARRLLEKTTTYQIVLASPLAAAPSGLMPLPPSSPAIQQAPNPAPQAPANAN